MRTPNITRRGLLIGGAVGGGLIVAWALLPRSYEAALAPGRDEYSYGAWLKIGSDGVVTVALPQLEMGQGISTLLPQIIAMELGADWRQMAVEPTPSSGAYANVPLAARWAEMWMPSLSSQALAPDSLVAKRYAELRSFNGTADGTSIAAYEVPCREAAAAARVMLCKAAASQWGIDWEQCEVAGGLVRYDKQALRFGALAEAASKETPPDPPVLRPQIPNDIAAQALAPTDDYESSPEPNFPRLDLPTKVDGSYNFASDVRLPDMLYAAILHGPQNSASLDSYDSEAALTQSGGVQLVADKHWIAAVASNWWAAERALQSIAANFRTSANVDSADIENTLENALSKGEESRIAERGEGYDNSIKSDINRRYSVAPAIHANPEPASATARFSGDRLELWVASQAPEQTRKAVADALDIPLADIVLYPMPAGGGFDRLLEHDHAIEAAIIARKAKRPVQLIWSRKQEVLAGKVRSPAAAVMSARMSRNNPGQIGAIRTRIAAPSSAKEFGERLFGNKRPAEAIASAAGAADPLAVEGGMPHYAIPNAALDHVPTKLTIPCGRMRGNAHSYTAFFVESFIDEIAAEQKREPLSYRIAMLGNDARMATCLQTAAGMAGWDGGLDQSGLGLACHKMYAAGPGRTADQHSPSEGRIACIATARQGVGGVRVIALSAAVDIGRIINWDVARQQIEGGLIYGISLALGCSPTWEKGLPSSTRLSDMGLPRLGDTPKISVQFIESGAPYFDPGELGVAVVAPAIANALYSATGLRFRRLPLLSEGL